jgi:hypothetical protein
MTKIKFFILIIAISLFMPSAFAQKTKIKIPHSHAAMEGGTVLMLGDDHFEVRAAKEKNVLEIYASDKLRDPVAIDQFSELIITLTDGNAKKVLEPKPGDQPSMFSVQLPSQYSEESRIEIFAKRKNAPRNHITASGPQSIALKEVFSKAIKDPHAGHKM